MEGGEEGGMRRRRRVVVVGGGVAGAFLAKTLQSDSDLVLIDPKEYFEIPWAYLRAMVEPPFAEKILIKHTDYLTNAVIVTSRAIGVTETEVLTDEGRSIPYDFLIVATGHADPVPRSRNGRIEQLREEHEKIKSSSSVLIIGGGRRGVELAGEIASDYPEKKVTLVHKGSRLLEHLGPKASVKALKWLKKKDVEVLFEQTVDPGSVSEGQKEFKTSAGKPVAADCHFVCTGWPLASSWLQETVLGKSLDEHGRLMVDGNLRVKGQKNVFAIGDITDIKELKQGYVAQAHAAVVAKNVKLLMKGAKETKIVAYKAGSVFAVISLGRKSAVAQFPFATISGRVAAMTKSKDLFVAWTRKTMGLSP
ncbi:apoptosis-inducing factor 2-like [Ananas comosus]|uniref:Apoptosis-inducing factor 2-like n=1 Tax=Ananas comosus TaxID=4615 RepID=A0A6P5G968_ANACO|nr:apoptosis-inducing factor 2-like [Ananas comosus]